MTQYERSKITKHFHHYGIIYSMVIFLALAMVAIALEAKGIV
jgi:hypothetical protein